MICSPRALIFRSAGYRTLLCSDLCSALTRAGNADLVLLGHSFGPWEQDSFVEQVQETNPDLHVLCLYNGIVAPEMLLQACSRFRSCQPAAPLVDAGWWPRASVGKGAAA